jgi:diguanylate cyclase (GGDEF)-like protein
MSAHAVAVEPDDGLAATTIGDCASMLGAVEVRLLEAVDRRRNASDARTVHDAVLECVQALHQLQTLLAGEGRRFARIQALAEDARARLAQAQQDLAITRHDERQARHRSLHDGLTALPNRSYFRQRLDAALETGGSGGPDAPTLAVLYLDLDGMKAINDIHGHCAGDEVLRVVAARLVHAVRGSDMVSRQGGDEFALLITDLPGRDEAAAMVGELARKLCQSIATPVRMGELEVLVQASIGIALHPCNGRSADALLEHADAAMYRAKRGRCRYAFFDALGAA